MTDIRKRTIITLFILGAVISFLVLFAIKPIFGQIKTESGNFAIQKKELLESDIKAQNIRDFNDNFKQYQPNLEKMGSIFLNISEPIEFIQFLEKEAEDSRLSIEIAPPVFKGGDNDSWPVFDFSLSLKGSFPNLLRFLERIDSAQYLVEIVKLTIGKNSDKTDSGVTAALLIKVYAK